MSAHPSLELLRERVASVPAALQIACDAPLPELDDLAAADRYVVTGGGLSEGPARVLVALLQRAGGQARFVAQSAFVRERARDPHAGLILFSQGLAPNARLPLGFGLDERGASEPRFAATLLVTAVRPAPRPGVASIAQRLLDAGQRVWTLPPASEDRLLLRVVGPAVALVAAIRLADALVGSPAGGRVLDGDGRAALEAIAGTAARRIDEAGLDLFGQTRSPVALVAGEALHELTMPLRWKLLEGLRVPDPPVWDPLQVVHGPLQAFYDDPLTLVALRLRDDGLDEVYARLRRVLRADRHRLLELHASSPSPVALIELDAALDACLLRTLARHPLALDDWPSRGLDGPIYDLDPDLLAPLERA